MRVPSESFIDPHMVPWTELTGTLRSQQTNINNVNNVNKKVFTW